MTYSTEDERIRFIVGLRDLAKFLEANPDVPAPQYGTTVHVFPPHGGTEERRAEIDAIASRIGVEPCEFTAGHYAASRYFGPVEYRAVAIDHDTNEPDGE